MNNYKLILIGSKLQMKSFRCRYLFCTPTNNRASVLCQSYVRQAISTCLFIANFGVEHSKGKRKIEVLKCS